MLHTNHIQRAARVSNACEDSTRSNVCSEVTALSFAPVKVDVIRLGLSSIYHVEKIELTSSALEASALAPHNAAITG